MWAGFTAGEFRDVIASQLAEAALSGSSTTWVLSNHDVTRPVTRYGRADTAFAFQSKRVGTPTDLGEEHGDLEDAEAVGRGHVEQAGPGELLPGIRGT